MNIIEEIQTLQREAIGLRQELVKLEKDIAQAEKRFEEAFAILEKWKLLLENRSLSDGTIISDIPYEFAEDMVKALELMNVGFLSSS